MTGITLPGKTRYGGYVYALAFDNGTVKVGATANPRGRFATHESSARSFGIALAAQWLSPMHEGHYATETKLVGIARDLGGAVVGNEFFTAVDFTDLVQRARRLTFPPVDIEAAKSRESEAYERLRDTFGQVRAARTVSYPDAIHEAISPFFGRRPDGTYEVSGPGDVVEPAPRELLEQMAEASGRNVAEIADMDFIDLLEQIIATAVRTEALNLRIYARMNGRADLELPIGLDIGGA